MMAAARPRERLLDRLPPVRGAYLENAPLHRYAWFRAGGPAEVLYEPADEDDLAEFLARRPRDAALTVVGLCSNLLVRDGGVRGVVVRLGRAFSAIAAEDESVIAGAGAADIAVARFAAERGLAGLEFLRGIPGGIGGALRMNAGAYGAEIADVLTEAVALDGEGRRHRASARALGLSYRRSEAPGDWIFTAPVFAPAGTIRRRSRPAWRSSPRPATRRSRRGRAPAAARSRTRRAPRPGN
jgi:UDP-N-acetylmuramate dehydrogenase